MDNITHSLVGIAIAEVGLRCKPTVTDSIEKQKSWRLWVYSLSILANNFPDIDLTYSMNAKLDYLLHHRGHTHTLLVAVTLSLSLLSIPWIYLKVTDQQWTRSQWRFIALMSMIGGIVHISLDACNVYGVHPFWPLQNRWYYGDLIFIIEPFLWVSLITVFFHSLKSKIAKWAAGIIVLIALLLCWFTPFVPHLSALILTTWTLSLAAIAHSLRPAYRPWPGLVSIILLFAIFWVGREQSRRVLSHQFQANWGNDAIHALALSPLPANPFCFLAMGIATPGQRYVLAKAVVAPFPSILSSSQCPDTLIAKGLAPLQPMQQSENAHIRWIGKFEAPLAELRQLSTTCLFKAFLEFARMPFWTEHWFGDLRFDRGSEAGFATLSRSDETTDACDINLPKWTPPLAPLLPSTPKF